VNDIGYLFFEGAPVEEGIGNVGYLFHRFGRGCMASDVLGSYRGVFRYGDDCFVVYLLHVQKSRAGLEVCCSELLAFPFVEMRSPSPSHC